MLPPTTGTLVAKQARATEDADPQRLSTSERASRAITPMQRPALLLPLILAGALLLAGCGDEQDRSTPLSAPTTQAPTEVAPAPAPSPTPAPATPAPAKKGFTDGEVQERLVVAQSLLEDCAAYSEDYLLCEEDKAFKSQARDAGLRFGSKTDEIQLAIDGASSYTLQTVAVSGSTFSLSEGLGEQNDSSCFGESKGCVGGQWQWGID